MMENMFFIHGMSYIASNIYKLFIIAHTVRSQHFIWKKNLNNINTMYLLLELLYNLVNEKLELERT